MLDTKKQNEIDRIFSKFRGCPDELIPVMEAVQEAFGYLSAESMLSISDFLRVPESKVYGVATFYALFKIKPRGRRLVSVCRGTACHVRGGAQILTEVQNCLGIGPGETSEDLEYSLETISCFGSCALAPVIVDESTVYGRMTPDKVKQILGKKENP